VRGGPLLRAVQAGGTLRLGHSDPWEFLIGLEGRASNNHGRGAEPHGASSVYCGTTAIAAHSMASLTSSAVPVRRPVEFTGVSLTTRFAAGAGIGMSQRETQLCPMPRVVIHSSALFPRRCWHLWRVTADLSRPQRVLTTARFCRGKPTLTTST
jgi:hypothetical protein